VSTKHRPPILISLDITKRHISSSFLNLMGMGADLSCPPPLYRPEYASPSVPPPVPLSRSEGSLATCSFLALQHAMICCHPEPQRRVSHACCAIHLQRALRLPSLIQYLVAFSSVDAYYRRFICPLSRSNSSILHETELSAPTLVPPA
jgi:hypothetical protein